MELLLALHEPEEFYGNPHSKGHAVTAVSFLLVCNIKCSSTHRTLHRTIDIGGASITRHN